MRVAHKNTFETVIKSGPKNTEVTPSTWNSCRAKGDLDATFTFGASKVPDSRTVIPGRNFKLFGFGVSCVCINKDLPTIMRNVI